MTAQETTSTCTPDPKLTGAAHEECMTTRMNTDPLPALAAAIDPLLSITELSAYLRAPVSSIYAWRSKGEGPRGFRVGRRVLYRLSEVDRWVESRADLR